MKNNGQTAEKVDLKRLDTLSTKIVYWLFQAMIVLTMVVSIVLACMRVGKRETTIEHIFLCAVALILFNIPSFLKRRFHIYIPTVLQVFTLVFIFAHFILGEIQGLYNYSASFDKILHTTSGLAIATIGFSLVNILNTSTNTHLKLSPFFVALFSFCFALAVAVLWEIFEFAADSIFGTNMQRYVPPTKVATEVPPAQGYGLLDTMGDIIVSTVAALVVCVLGYISLRTKSNVLNKFLLRKVPDYEFALGEAREAGDQKLVRVLEQAIADSVLEQEKRQKKETENAESEKRSETAENDDEKGT